MEYRVIDNLENASNHSNRIKELFSLSDNVLVASPYLMIEFADFLSEIDISRLKKFHLITTLAPKSFDQIKKVSSLVSLIEFPEILSGRVKCQISLNNRLHGKVYIFQNNGTYIAAIISSANFTGSGLSRNHEWGVEISSVEEIEKLIKSLTQSIEFDNLTLESIYKMQNEVNNFLDRQPDKEEREIDLSLASSLDKTGVQEAFDENSEFWLKPIGVSTHPVLEDRLFDKVLDYLHFSKQRPTGVKVNDILIAYGVGTTKMLSVYKVLSQPQHVTQEDINNDDWLERWPWYVEAENLTPRFGANWPAHNLVTKTLLNEYLEANPDRPITAVGGQTLGGLNYGKDKLKLAPEFAKFIIDKILAASE